jgi:ACT domain-containing protein
MTNKQAIGRPNKVNYTVMSKLEDALGNGASVTEACQYAGISRDTFYRHFRTEQIFADKMKTARTTNLYLSIPDAVVAYDF